MEQTERLKLIREALRLSAPEFAARLGYFNAGSYRNIENGADGITDKFILRLKKSVPELNMDWFETGKGGMFTEVESSNSININTTTMRNLTNEERIDRLLDQNDKLIEILHYQAATINNLSALGGGQLGKLRGGA